MGNSSASLGQLQKHRGGWLLCLDENQRVKCVNREQTRPSDARLAAERARQESKAQLETLMRELFRLQDLNKNGFLEEQELIKLNQKIAMLHYGKDSKNAAEVEQKYRNHFREHLDPEGKPVDFKRFQEYMIGMMNSIDPDPRVQEMTLEQWIAEAESGRAAFFCNSMSSQSDYEYTQNMSFRQSNVFGSAAGMPPTATLPGAGSPTQGGGKDLKDSAVSSVEAIPSSWSGQSFGLERLPPEAGSVEFSPTAGARPPTSGLGFGVAVPPTASGCTGMQSGEFLPQPAGEQSGYASMESFVPSPSRMQASSNALSSIPERKALPEHGTLQGSIQAPESPASGCAFKEGQVLEVWSDSKKAWLPGVVLAAYSSDTTAEGYRVPAGTVKVSSNNGVKWVMPDQISRMLRVASYVGTTYRKGDAIEVWSDSKSTWMEGIVQEAYAVDTEGKGFTIPAGSLLVRSSAGTSKWVMPDQISKTLRPSSSHGSKPDAGSPDFAKGEKIQVWSDSRQQWLLGVVQEVFLVDSKSEGFDVPAGSVKVLSETGVKWVLPTDRARLLRKVQAPASLDLKAMLKAALSEPSALHRHAESVWTSALLPGQQVLPAEHAAYALEGLADQFGVRLELEGQHLSSVKQRAYSFAAGSDGLTAEQFESLCREMMSELYSSL